MSAHKRKVNVAGKPVRVMFTDPTDPERKRKIPGDSVDINILQSSPVAVIGILKKYRDRATAKGIPRNSAIFRARRPGKPGLSRRILLGEPMELESMIDEEIEELVEELFSASAPIILRVQDR